MPDQFIGGNDSYVKLGAVAYGFNKWNIPIDAGVKTFYVFGTQGQLTVAGGYGAEITAEGVYNAGNFPMIVGNLYDVHLGFAPGVELLVTARLANAEFSTQISQGGDPAGVKVTFKSHGNFSLVLS